MSNFIKTPSRIGQTQPVSRSPASSPREKMRSDLRNITDPSVFSAVLFKEKEKKKDRRRSEARDRKHRIKPHMLTAKNACDESTDQEPFRNGLFDSGVLFVPQMNNIFGGQHVHSLDHESKQMLSNFHESVNSFTEKIDGLKATVGLDEPTAVLLKDTTDGMSDLATLLVLVAIVWILQPKTRNEKLMAVFMFMSVLATRKTLKEFFLSSPLMKWFQGSKAVVPQAFGFASDCDSFATVLVTMINTVICAQHGTSIFDPKTFVKTMGDLGRVNGTVSNMVKGVNLVVTYVFSSIDSWYNGKAYFVQTGHAFIDGFLQESTAIIDSYEAKTLYNLESTLETVKAVIEHGVSIQMKIPGTSQFAGVRACVMNHIAELTKIRKALNASNFRYAGIRQEPAVLFFAGPPGSMKSQAMQHVAHAINARIMNNVDFDLYCENPASGVFTRNFENVYWDGYKPNQNIVIFDDIFQARDIAGSPDNEAMNFIRAVNVFNYDLHMADLPAKGNTTFRSKFVLANSNMKNIKLDSIHDVGAVKRRMDLVYDVCIKSEYAKNPDAPVWKRKPDPKKFPVWTAEECPDKPELIGTTRTHPSMCDFHLQKLVAGDFVDAGVIHEFAEVLDNYYDLYMCKTRQFESYIKTLDDTLDTTRREYKLKLGEFPVWSERDSDSGLDMEEVSPQIGDDPGVPAQVLDDVEEHGDQVMAEFIIEESYLNRVEFPETVPDEVEIDPLTLSHLTHLALENNKMYHVVFSVYCRILAFSNQRALRWNTTQLLNITMYIIGQLVWDQFHIDFNSNDGRGWIDPEHQPDLNEYEFIREAYVCVAACLLRDLEEGSYSPQMDDGGPSGLTREDREEVLSDIRQALSGYTLDKLKALEVKDHAASLAVEYFAMRIHSQAVFRIGYSMLVNDAMNAALFAYDKLQYDVHCMEQRHDEIMDCCFDMYEKLERSSTADKRKRLVVACHNILSAASAAASPWVIQLGNIYSNCVAYIATAAQSVSHFVGTAAHWLTHSEYGEVHLGLLKMSGALLFGAGIARFCRYVFPMVAAYFGDEGDEPHSDERHTRNPTRQKLRRVARLFKPRAGNPQSISSGNPNLVSVMQMVVKRSMFSLWLPLGEEATPEASHRCSGYALGVRGRTLMVPYHFGSCLDAKVKEGSIKMEDSCVLKRPGSDSPFFWFSVKEFLDGFFDWGPGEEQDIAFVKMPKHFQPVKDIVSHIVTEKVAERYTKVDSVLYIPRDDRELHSVVAQRGSNRKIGSPEYEDYVIKDVYYYNAHTTEGDCGSVLYVNDKSSPALITGMHVAGATALRVGIAACITREFVEAGLEFAGEDYKDPDIDIPVVPTDTVPPQMFAVGQVAPGTKFPNRIGRTKLRPSPLKDKAWVSKKRPSRLLPFTTQEGDRVDPLRKALWSYGVDVPNILSCDVKEAKDSLKDMLNHNSDHDVERKVYGFDEAVLGDGPGSEFASIPRGTSAGYPYNCMPGITSKARFFGVGDNYDLDNPECAKLRTLVYLTLQSAKKGERRQHVFTDSLKDERRSFAKYEAGETRMFSGCPIVLLIVSRMLFGAFQKWIVKNRIDNGIAIGINEYGDEWDYVADKLHQFGVQQNVGAGDYHGFDKRQFPIIMQAILEIIQDWYDSKDPEENKARETVWLELTNSLHINDGVLMYWFMSLPSGHPLTAIVNCMYNHMCFRICWESIMFDKGWNAEFNKNVYLLVLGDDNVYSVKDRHFGFHEKALAVAMRKLGHIYTPENKDLANHADELRYIEEVTFLKRSFIKYRGLYRAPLDLETVMDIPNWIRDGANVYGDTEANVKIALEELSLHGIDVYNALSKKLLNAVRDTHGLSMPECTSYNKLFELVTSRGTSPRETRSFIFGYGITSGKNAEPQIGDERSDEEQASVLTDTSRMACWQPQLYPGPRKPHVRLIHRRVVQRIATTNDTPIYGNDNRLTVTRTEASEAVEDQSSSVTRFVADADVVVGKPLLEQALDSRLLDSLRTGSQQTVADFLSRPTYGGAGVFATSDIANTPLRTAVIPNDVLQDPLWANKIAGSGGFRGELHVRVIVNANRFQQGRYILCWIPSGGAVQYEPWIRMHRATLCETTQLPHVEIDIACDTEVVLIIPHVTVQGWAQLTTAAPYFGNNGRVGLIPYSPLVAPTGSTTASYTMFYHWENVEFAMPLNPQMSMRAKTKIKRRVSPSELEQKSQDIGPLESAMSKISVAAGKLGGIPLLSSVAHPVSWATDLAAQVAGAFGWSRPHNSEHTQIMTQYSAHRMTNVDVADNSTKLGYSDNNHIEDVVGFAGTDIDEMALQYVQSISAYNTKTDWTTSQTYGTRLFELFCCPRDYFMQTVQTATTLTHMTPVCFVSTFFAMYRGSLRFTFKIVKTEFHSGRLQISFLPIDTNFGTQVSPTTADCSYLHREIIDVRDKSEFTFVAPWTSISQYKSMSGVDRGYGKVLVDVLDPLVAPASVSTSITILVEVSGCDDLEFAQPNAPSWQPCVQYVPQAGGNTCLIVSEDIGGSHNKMEALAARACIGERITSFRQMIKRFAIFKKIAGTGYTAASKRFLFTPFINQVCMIGSSAVVTKPTNPGDLITMVSMCYAIQRGSVRFKIIDTSSTQMTKTMTSSFSTAVNTGAFGIGAWDTVDDSVNWTPNRSQAFFRSDIGGCVEVEFPYYNRFHSTAVADTMSIDATTVPQITYTGLGTAPRVQGSHYAFVAPTPDPLMFRAAGEDFSLGLFVSVPPVLDFSINGF